MVTVPKWVLGFVAVVLVVLTAWLTSTLVQSRIVYVPQSVPESEQVWRLGSEHLPRGGMPLATDKRYNFRPEDEKEDVPGITVLVREGFVVGHCDRAKIPLWVCMKWSKADLAATEKEPSPDRKFKVDYELPSYARAPATYKGSGKYDRGHMARNHDNLAWGEDNALKGDLMSNIVPQSHDLNAHAWRALEDEHRFAVRKQNISALWIISGSLIKYQDQQLKPEEILVNGVWVPYGTYKIIAWHDHKGLFHARGFILSQKANSRDPREYLVPIKKIEEETGLNFFPKLEEPLQSTEEAKSHTEIWKE